MWGTYVWLILVGLVLKINIVFSDEDCQVTQKPKLQIIFVVDYVLRANHDKWVKTQNLTAYHLIDFIKQNNFEAEYAVAGFADYPDDAGPRAVTNPELCYFLMERLTSDKNKIVSAISKDLFSNTFNNHSNHELDISDSLTTAMLFSAVDKRLNWNSGSYDNRGNLVRKIMIPMVYRDYTRILHTPGNRTRPKADGTDTCATALIPEIEQLDQVLFDNQFTVINSVLNLSFLGVHQHNLYKELFSNLFVTYYQATIPKDDEGLLDPDKFDYKAYAKKIYDVISREVMSCDWEDPIGYNTLGL